MAAFAAAPERAGVHVVFGVTPLAIPREVDLDRVWRLVARAAHEVHVCPAEWKIGLCVVIETPARPTVRVVTLLASRSQPSEVDVFWLVATDATDLGVLESRRDVALLAGRHGMKSQ